MQPALLKRIPRSFLRRLAPPSHQPLSRGGTALARPYLLVHCKKGEASQNQQPATPANEELASSFLGSRSLHSAYSTKMQHSNGGSIQRGKGLNEGSKGLISHGRNTALVL
jgi:hypothetical protein